MPKHVSGTIVDSTCLNWTTILARTCSAITRQPIELERLVEPSEGAESLLASIFFNWEILVLKLLWSSVTSLGGHGDVVGT